MSDSRSTIIWNKLGRTGLLAQAGVVSAIVVIGCVMVAPVAYNISGTMGLAAAAAGAGVCLIGAQLALAITSFFRTSAALYAIVIGMLARALVPLLFGVALHFRLPSLAQAGMIYYLLVFYMATLATETVLLLAHVPHAATSQKAI